MWTTTTWIIKRPRICLAGTHSLWYTFSHLHCGLCLSLRGWLKEESPGWMLWEDQGEGSGRAPGKGFEWVEFWGKECRPWGRASLGLSLHMLNVEASARFTGFLGELEIITQTCGGLKKCYVTLSIWGNELGKPRGRPSPVACCFSSPKLSHSPPSPSSLSVGLGFGGEKHQVTEESWIPG
jgi:hypothetical protein